ncbi:MAG: 3-deoxy-D-manno-octulosonic acid transferase [Melioribacteraceae bacterium]|nr:3-deoxy-D-manno-octulosonic acid transferase [Melioribacteraceae bacterium]MCF8264309.1 3-deoxy-D-manno-octulosonic acid transferase [Melioribacteraceae bacterium]MCF8412917.1 3-deoxy-D-manno-octulosonic acid transferase [Melioribacteraceae bacterium]MCF8431420.1 3-deoxy-D-manno-octulosonic acid transferase [Melioribacteraceae bacterium]
MSKIWKSIYNLLIVPLFYFMVLIYSFFNSKVRRGIKDRKKIFENLIINFAGLKKGRKTIWFHSASMGEFEQAKPIIEDLKSNYDVNIIVTFFSPSGYDNSLRYPYADIVSYLPFDFPGTIKRFIKIVKPRFVVFMRYDLWPNLVWQLASSNIPIFLVDATLRTNSRRNLPIAKGVSASLFRRITKVLTVTDSDAENFLKFGVNQHNIISVGDTRFDRVFQKSQIAKQEQIFPEEFFLGKKVFVFGSSWPSDEAVIFPSIIKLQSLEEELISIVVPHEPTVNQLERIENELNKKISHIRFSRLRHYNSEKVIIVDAIGILLTLYRYAHVAFVGGGFKPGVHSVLEPAVYGIPVLFGPKIENSREARNLVEMGSGFKITGNKNAYRTLRKLFRDDEFRISSGNISKKYVTENLGATERINTELKKIF